MGGADFGPDCDIEAVCTDKKIELELLPYRSRPQQTCDRLVARGVQATELCTDDPSRADGVMGGKRKLCLVFGYTCKHLREAPARNTPANAAGMRKLMQQTGIF